ncbi:MAG: DUF4215 domain-containing protein [Kofleriaceae bacterium]
MTRIPLATLLLGSLLVACGGGGGGDDHQTPIDAPIAHAVCGDGIIDVATETCDDGNTMSGDGCSSSCQIEVVNKCGNGAIDSGETCDDGNQAGSDGCSAQCTVETGYMCTGAPSVCTVMTAEMGTCANPMPITLALNDTLYTGTGTGDTTNATNQVAAGMCDTYSSSGGAPDQIWTFVNPVAQPVLITLHPGASSFDAVLRLTTTACDVGTQVPDDVLPVDGGHSDGCADLGGSMVDEYLNYNSLPAGTYYIVVDGYSSDASDLDFGPYTFEIEAGHGTCGNGTIDFGETCDDHNTATGDGCDDTCHVQTGYACTGTPSMCVATCGNGALDDGETCDDHNQTANDGCSSTCQVETGYVCTGSPSVCHQTVCGDGVAEGTETCDDHNTTANDGCSATCSVETGYTCTGTPSTCLFGGTCAQPFPLTFTVSGAGEIASGTSDTTHATDGFVAGACDGETSAGAAPDQTWVFTTTVAQPVLITATSPADVVLRLTTVACDITTSVPDTATHADGCADLHASGSGEVLNYDMLPAGTYYLTVDGYGAASTGPYSVTVKAGNTGVCGDGIVDVGEECDSSAGHDRCDATCHLVFDTTDTEANNDGTGAQVITPVHHIIEGSLPVGDLDVYTFTLTAPSMVEIETYTTFESSHTSTSDSSVANLECPTADTLLHVFDGTSDPTVDANSTYSDDDSGDAHCSYVGPTAALAAGTYYFTVHEYQLNDVIPRYLVDFNVTPM